MQAQDTLRPQPVQFMQATLDRNQSFGDGDALPPLWHWLYFLEAKRTSELGRDAPPPQKGRVPAARGPAAPHVGWGQVHVPCALDPRAGCVETFHHQECRRKRRSGKLCFVMVEHEVFQGDQLALASPYR